MAVGLCIRTSCSQRCHAAPETAAASVCRRTLCSYGMPWPWLFTGADAVRIANGHAALVPRYAASCHWRIVLRVFCCKFVA
jgi:hypothetical protein